MTQTNKQITSMEVLNMETKYNLKVVDNKVLGSNQEGKNLYCGETRTLFYF